MNEWLATEKILLVAALGLVGLLAGALVALVARSLPERGRLLSRPACSSCSLELGWSAASQTFRLLGLARRCPACWNGPARADVALEAATTITFVVLAIRWPADGTLVAHLGFAALLMTILAIDLRHREVYLVLGYGGVVGALALAPLTMSGAIGNAALGSAIGALIFGIFYLVGRVIYGGEPLGSGDVTIAALLGAMAGFPAVFTALVLGILVGGVGAVVVLFRSGSRRTVMPYGPALCLGGLITLLLG